MDFGQCRSFCRCFHQTQCLRALVFMIQGNRTCFASNSHAVGAQITSNASHQPALPASVVRASAAAIFAHPSHTCSYLSSTFTLSWPNKLTVSSSVDFLHLSTNNATTPMVCPDPGQSGGVYRGEQCENSQRRSPVDHSDITTNVQS